MSINRINLPRCFLQIFRADPTVQEAVTDLVLWRGDQILAADILPLHAHWRVRWQRLTQRQAGRVACPGIWEVELE